MATKKKTESTTTSTLAINPIGIGTVTVSLVGETEIILHRLSQKMKDEIQNNEGGLQDPKRKKKQPRTKEVIEREYQDAFYLTKEGNPAFKALGLKLAMVRACRDLDMHMTEARGRLHVLGENGGNEDELLEIIPDGGKPYMRTDFVKVGNGGGTLRYRPGIPAGWKVNATIKYNKAPLTEEAIVNLLNQAGFGVGLCEWRPEKNGSYGRFHVESITTWKNAA